MSNGRMRGLTILALGLLLASGLPPLHAEAPVSEAETGFRMHDYRAPVPATAPGATTVDWADVERLIDEKALLLDVVGLRNFRIRADGTWIASEARDSLPGAVWLPVVGWGKLEPWEEAYLTQSVEELTGNRRDTPIVIFCKVDCWLSWNTAKRLSALGYSQLYWFPDGTDLWADFGNPLARVEPYPVDPSIIPAPLVTGE
ncbi:PQQ-dependent catabolism-associated CXXCW motif protein [Paracoccus caeni]|uniref:PQQ-dependent catabolism-associated CXXCW motif protein n=1 Tax=Paracoccus caeni TaxID=657651 RepID=A0A934SGY8_9RHOB|nr:PQQ-dependent catabolism-associated CXXCW motif protein [Paracoccus caeni]